MVTVLISLAAALGRRPARRTCRCSTCCWPSTRSTSIPAAAGLGQVAFAGLRLRGGAVGRRSRACDRHRPAGPPTMVAMARGGADGAGHEPRGRPPGGRAGRHRGPRPADRRAEPPRAGGAAGHRADPRAAHRRAADGDRLRPGRPEADQRRARPRGGRRGAGAGGRRDGALCCATWTCWPAPAATSSWCCCPTATSRPASGIAETLREQVGDAARSESWPATVSMGVACAPPLPLDPEALLLARRPRALPGQVAGRDRVSRAGRNELRGAARPPG